MNVTFVQSLVLLLPAVGLAALVLVLLARPTRARVGAALFAGALAVGHLIVIGQFFAQGCPYEEGSAYVDDGCRSLSLLSVATWVASAGTLVVAAAVIAWRGLRHRPEGEPSAG
jgi:hypothetical protein